MPDETRPNILLIISDQHHPGVMGCAGDRLAVTPHLDQLAARGTRFTNAHCPFPLCGPSRMSFMTARHPHHIGCYTNACELRSDVPTFASAFAMSGYETLIAGRMHFSGYDQQHGFEKRLMGDVAATAYLCPHNGWRLYPVVGPLRAACGMGLAPLELSGPGTTGYQTFDETLSRTTARWIEDRARQNGCGRDEEGRPFMLTMGTILPHCPFIASPDDFYHFYEQLSEDDLPDPRLDAHHPVIAALRERWHLNGDEPVSKETQRVVRAAYYGLCRHVDRLIGRVLQTLHDTGLDRNTIVLYTSDHGEQLGEHGLWWKSTFYQGSVGIPMIISHPPALPQGQIVPQNVSLMDVGPTLLDLTGSKPLPHADGRSLRPLIEHGAAAPWDDTVFAEGVFGHVPGRMVRRGPWKLNHYTGHPPELYNLQVDPEELVNRASDPSCAGVLKELTDLVHADGWQGEAVRKTLDVRNFGLAARNDFVARTSPPEPNMPWFDKLPVNHIDRIPGSTHTTTFDEPPAFAKP